MPGIAGVIARRPSDECRRLTEEMIGRMRHESFYTAGSYSNPDLGICVGWVALPGSLPEVHPIMNSRGEVVLFLAGECRSDSTTSTAQTHSLPELYERLGERFFAGLNGVFSGLLVDTRHRKAFLFNDRYGIERLYYHEQDDSFFFASEAKALLTILPELRQFDSAGLAEFLRYGCTLEWKSLFRGIKLLPAASLWAFQHGRLSRQCYFTPATWECQTPAPAQRFESEFDETFKRILPRYFDSHGDVGISLTAGLDTRMIMACRPEGAQRLSSYTFCGVGRDTLDVQLAARIASVCRVPHHVVRIGNTFFTDFSSLADRTVYVTDGSVGVCGAHEIYLNRYARQLAPLRITGNFGSEILRGMTTFKPLGVSADLFDPELATAVSGHKGLSSEDHPVSFAAFKEIPWLLSGIVRAGQSQLIIRTPYLDNDLVALAFRTPRNMRGSASAAMGLVCRNNVQLGHIPTDRGVVPESRLASLARFVPYRASFKLDHWYSNGAPSWFSFLDEQMAHYGLSLWPRGLHKYLLYGRWFRTELAEYVRDRLSDAATRQSGRWNTRFLNHLAHRHIRGHGGYAAELNAVLTIEAIDRLLLRSPR